MRNHDIPMESPNKYGRFDDDLSELVAGVNGSKPVKRDRASDSPEPSRESTVDADFLRTLRDSVDKYGK